MEKLYMLDNTTRNKLSEMKLNAMITAYDNLVETQQFSKLDNTQILAILIDHEYLSRQNKKRQRLLDLAKLRLPQACIQDIDYKYPRRLSKEQLHKLLSSQFIANNQNALLIGPTGIGKTYIACALANNFCSLGYTVRYYRLSKLKEQLRLSFADGTYTKFLMQLARLQLLIIDDFGLEVLDEQTRSGLLEIIEDRFGKQATIIASQLPVAHWHDYFGNDTNADAFLDRMAHSSTKIILEGESLRKVKN